MTYKEFNDWCNNRVCDGHWGLKEAILCVGICEIISNKPRWRREKAWQKHELRMAAEEIVTETNKLIAIMEKNTAF